MKNVTKDIELAREELAPLWDQFAARGSSSDAVFNTVREAILSRVLLPLQSFAEEDFANVFGVSRTPVREAVLRLEAEGLIDRLSKRGLVIPEISPTEILEVYDVRIALDGLAAERAAESINPPELAQLQWLSDRMKAAGQDGDYATMSELNLEFHELIATASRNSFLCHQIQEVQSRVRRFEHTTFAHSGRWEQAVAEHELIIGCLQRRDVASAKQSAEDHMRHARQARLEMLREQRR